MAVLLNHRIKQPFFASILCVFARQSLYMGRPQDRAALSLREIKIIRSISNTGIMIL
jgi:hypothetical protein